MIGRVIFFALICLSQTFALKIFQRPLVPTAKNSFTHAGFNPTCMSMNKKSLSLFQTKAQDRIESISNFDFDSTDISNVGENAGVFNLSEQKITSWLQFFIAVTGLLSVINYAWISEQGLQWGSAYQSWIEHVTWGNSTSVITVMLFLFSVAHSGLASLRPLGEKVVGAKVWRYLFAGVSLPLAYTALSYFMTHRNDGIQLWNFQSEAWLKPVVFILSFISFLFLYPSTFNLLEIAAVETPKLHLWGTGIARITRHPQAIGQFLWSLAHTLYIGSSFTLVTSLMLCAHHLFAIWNGDRRLLAQFGDKFKLIQEKTSIVPFAAILSGKQRLPDHFWKEEMWRLPYVTIMIGSVAAYLLHPWMR